MAQNSFLKFNLSNEIIEALHKLHYTYPTEVQSEVIPLVLASHDVVVQSQTGSGKTAAYGIPICELVDWQENKPQALILTPTRELAVQVKEELSNIGRLKRMKVAAVYGKQPIAIQKTELKQKNHVIVGTPGRMYDHIQRGNLSIDRVKYLVIDEADEMLNMGFIDQVADIIRELPDKRVTLLFSATLPDTVKELATSFLSNPIYTTIYPKDQTKNQIDYAYYEVQEEEKWPLLRNVLIIENSDQCIIFCRTKERVDTLCDKLQKNKVHCEKIHGGLKQEERFRVMNDFRQGKFRYLIATDVAARGIDIDKISLILHYDFPDEVERYVHRSGRTGRAGHKGRSIAFVTENEIERLEEVEEYMDNNIRKLIPPTAEQIQKEKPVFEEKLQAAPIKKPAKNEQLNKGIMKIYFNGGKKKKLRAVDFVGTIAKIEGINAADIGIINIMDSATYVEILNGKGPLVLAVMKHTTIKGKLLKVHEAREYNK